MSKWKPNYWNWCRLQSVTSPDCDNNQRYIVNGSGYRLGKCSAGMSHQIVEEVNDMEDYLLNRISYDIDALTAERDELQRRLDAVVELLEGDDEDTREFLAALHAGAKAIAEGKPRKEPTE